METGPFLMYWAFFVLEGEQQVPVLGLIKAVATARKSRKVMKGRHVVAST